MTDESIFEEPYGTRDFHEYISIGTILASKLDMTDESLQNDLDCAQDVIKEIICAQDKRLEQLQKDNQDLMLHFEALMTDYKALQEALAPFANAAFYWSAFSDFQQVTREGIRVEHLRKAKKVLESS
jgi:propanediol dehydratase small subunit